MCKAKVAALILVIISFSVTGLVEQHPLLKQETGLYRERECSMCPYTLSGYLLGH